MNPRPRPGRHPVFTISLCQVLGQQVPAKWAKKLPAQIPAMRLGRLAAADPLDEIEPGDFPETGIRQPMGGFIR